MTPDQVERLTKDQVREVFALVEAATLADGVAPLSEQVLLDVSGPASDSTSRHILAYEGTRLGGYGHLDPAAPDPADPAGAAEATGELVVDPTYRRHGVGSALIRALEQALATGLADGAGRNQPAGAVATQDWTLGLWSHGNLDGARALALRDGYSPVRELWQMRRSLRADAAPLPAVSLPDGFRARHFVVGQDEQAWLEVNARAFAHHREQGRMTRQDLDRRIAEPWFDGRGLILVEDMRGLAPVLAASHWTKVVPAAGSSARQKVQAPIRATEGEVYVVAVDPAYQGLGLGRAVTVLGLEHLRAEGLTSATLYVDADNRAAVATYTRLDFARSAVDLMYSRTVHLAV